MGPRLQPKSFRVAHIVVPSRGCPPSHRVDERHCRGGSAWRLKRRGCRGGGAWQKRRGAVRHVAAVLGGNRVSGRGWRSGALLVSRKGWGTGRMPAEIDESSGNRQLIDKSNKWLGTSAFSEQIALLKAFYGRRSRSRSRRSSGRSGRSGSRSGRRVWRGGGGGDGEELAVLGRPNGAQKKKISRQVKKKKKKKKQRFCTPATT